MSLAHAAEWHEARRAGLGGSDAAAIIGVSPWRSAMDVWEEKTGQAPEQEERLGLWLGLRLEPVIFELYEAKTGHKVRRSTKVRAHPRYPFMLGTNIDGKVQGLPYVVEAKTAGLSDGWGEDGSTDIPAHYYPQVQHYLAVTGYAEAHVAVLIGLGGRADFRVFPIPRNDTYIADLEEVEDTFWREHVLTGIAPDPDGSPAAGSFLRRKHPASGPDLRPATPEESMLANRLTVARRSLDEAEQAHEQVKQLLMNAIGDDAGLVGSGFRITWKSSKTGERVNWEAIARAFRLSLEAAYRAGPLWDVGTGAPETLDAIISIHSEPVPGSRRFLATFDTET